MLEDIVGGTEESGPRGGDPFATKGKEGGVGSRPAPPGSGGSTGASGQGRGLHTSAAVGLGRKAPDSGYIRSAEAAAGGRTGGGGGGGEGVRMKRPCAALWRRERLAYGMRGRQQRGHLRWRRTYPAVTAWASQASLRPTRQLPTSQLQWRTQRTSRSSLGPTLQARRSRPRRRCQRGQRQRSMEGAAWWRSPL